MSATAHTSPARRAFRVHAWKDEDLEREMIADGFIGIGGSGLGDLAGFDREELRELLTERMVGTSPRGIGLYLGYWARFLWEAQVGDLVVLPRRDRSVAIGEFAGEYIYVPAADDRIRHQRRVAWLASIGRDELSAESLTRLSSKHTVQEFNNPGGVAELERLARLGQPSAS